MKMKSYDYTKRPYSTIQKYDIHPLSKNGFKQYLGNESYIHQYLGNKNPNRIENLQKENIEKEIKNETEKELSINNSEINKNIPFDYNEKDNIRSFNSKNSKINFNKNLKSEKILKNYDTLETNSEKSTKSITNKISQKNKFNSFNKIRPKTSYINTNTNGFNMNDIEEISAKTFQSKKLNNQTRFKNNYSSKIKLIEKYKNSIFDLDLDKFELNKNYEVKGNLNKSNAVNQLNKRLIQSCKGRNSNNINDFSNKDSHLKNENERLKEIFSNQTNNNFLKIKNLPKVSYIADQPKLVIRQFGYGGENKFLGGDYNPCNFEIGKQYDRNRRNFVGGLFKN